MFAYLHGFASGPGSFKARAFRERFEAFGIDLQVPALDEGDFERLTLTRQRKVVEHLLAQATPPRILIGSSMGGYLAALHASRHPVDALVLLAPAVDFASRWRERLGTQTLENWRREGFVEVEHYALGRKARLSFDLMEDAPRHEPWPAVTAPTLVLHGRHDDIVPIERVERWVAMTPSARLVVLDSGHEMTECIDRLFDETCRFLAGVAAVRQVHPSLAKDV